VSQNIQEQIIGLMNVEFERIWKEVVKTYFNVQSQKLPRGSIKTYKNISVKAVCGHAEIETSYFFPSAVRSLTV
jgi:hypothetical protein